MSQVTDIKENNISRPLLLLKKHGISLRGIGRGVGCSTDTVSAVLSEDKCGGVSHKITLKIRGRVEALLQAADEQTVGLWNEHDQLKDAA